MQSFQGQLNSGVMELDTVFKYKAKNICTLVLFIPLYTATQEK